MSSRPLSKRQRLEARRIATGQIKRLIGLPELKYFDNYTTGGIVTTTPVSVFGAAQGVTLSTRSGQQIRFHSVLGRFTLANSVNNTSSVQCRLIYGIDRENQAAAPTLAQVLQDASVPIWSPLNISTTRGRFSVLMDKTVVLGAGTVVASIPAGTMQMNAANNAVKFFKMYKKIKNTQEYTGTGAGNTSIGTPFLLTISDRTAGNEPVLTVYLRHKFTDV